MAPSRASSASTKREKETSNLRLSIVGPLYGPDAPCLNPNEKSWARSPEHLVTSFNSNSLGFFYATWADCFDATCWSISLRVSGWNIFKRKWRSFFFPSSMDVMDRWDTHRRTNPRSSSTKVFFFGWKVSCHQQEHRHHPRYQPPLIYTEKRRRAIRSWKKCCPDGLRLLHILLSPFCVCDRLCCCCCCYPTPRRFFYSPQSAPWIFQLNIHSTCAPTAGSTLD